MSDGMKLTGIGLAVACLIAVVLWCLWETAGGVSRLTQAIADPTERGLSYVAVAIALHALFGSSKKVEVEVKEK